MKEGISVIIPVYQVEKYLDRCLRSVLAQTLTSLEIILVDDGSLDKSGEICEVYAAKDERIQVIHQQNMGLGLARNAGLKRAGCEYVAFLDSDDYIAPAMYERLYEEAKQHDLDFVGSGECAVSDTDVKQRSYVEKAALFQTREEMHRLLFGMMGGLPEDPFDAAYGMSVWKNLYRREVIVCNGLEFESERTFISEDILFNMDFLFHSEKGMMLPECFYYYCENGGSLTNSYRPDRFEKDKQLYLEVVRKLSDWNLLKDGECYAKRLLISRGRYDVVHEIFASGGNIQPLKQRIKVICSDYEFQKAVKGYPIGRLPRSQAVFAFLMKRRYLSIQIALVKLRYRRR